MLYLTLKWIHIISATIIFGTGIGSAYYMFAANRRKVLSEMRFAVKFVVLADWAFTLPAIIVQFITGLLMAKIANISFFDLWIKWGLILYFFAGACWLPVVWLQIKMEKLIEEAIKENKQLDEKYWKMDFWWILLGSLAFPAVVMIFWLMVDKPV